MALTVLDLVNSASLRDEVGVAAGRGESEPRRRRVRSHGQGTGRNGVWIALQGGRKIDGGFDWAGSRSHVFSYIQ